MTNHPDAVKVLHSMVRFLASALAGLIVGIGVALPMTPMAALLGFTRLPVSYFAFLIPATLTYLLLVDIAKRRLARRLKL